jgi:hypothetical protein
MNRDIYRQIAINAIDAARRPPDNSLRAYQDWHNLASLHPNITFIALDGGPCSYKSKCEPELRRVLESKGYAVIFVPESATMLIQDHKIKLGGNGMPFLEFQEHVLHLGMRAEHAALTEATRIAKQGRKVVVFVDRSLLDSEAFITSAEFTGLLERHRLTHHMIGPMRYHAIAHMVTAANGAEEHYTLADNEARYEDLEGARMSDRRVLHSLRFHPHVQVIDNSTDEHGKVRRLIDFVLSVIGDPKPKEIERKFLIQGLNHADLPEHHHTVEITQCYLYPDPKRAGTNEVRRIRREAEVEHSRHPGIGASHTLTIKRDLDRPGEREEENQIITAERFERLMRDEADQNFDTLVKHRTSFFDGPNRFVIDQILEPDRLVGISCYMEVEGQSMEELMRIVPPSCCSVIAEVTGENHHSMRELARRRPWTLFS